MTGASTGIGSAIAVALGAAGAHVAGIYKTDPDGAERTETQVREHGVDCFSSRATPASDHGITINAIAPGAIDTSLSAPPATVPERL